ncbi:hypothetical protein NW762_008142 [Fusarium torreyae]|uniref:Uncharacterized protein n=1 Tax=Fusarium torreyae TaxID=1237075 RepID=A0A9W8VFC9_9HYPO|nr:hypothetical protein NW762_008142 [Fusarium torreyae]
MDHHAYTTLVLDLHGVLATYLGKSDVSLSISQVKAALDSPFWHDYERGKISKDECYEKTTKTFNFDLTSWTQALEQMRSGMQPNAALISAIREIKKNHPKLKVYCLGNIPRPELDLLKEEIDSWDIIDHFFASSIVKQRKPDIAIYAEFLEKAQVSASSCIFVDDRIESVATAQTLGLRGILFKTADSLITTLHNLLGDPVARAKAYLELNAKDLFCTLSTGQKQPDNYSQLIILQNTGDRDLVVTEQKGPTWNYFIGNPVFAGTTYPNDSDTTSLAMTVLDDVSGKDKLQARDAILSNLNPDGLPYCWLSKIRPRFDHCICANVFRFFRINDWDTQLPGVYDYLCHLLETRAYLHGSRYYASPDWFLYILSDLCARRPSDTELQRMRDLLVKSVCDRMGRDGDILDAVLRVLSAQSLGLQNERDLETVLEGQQLDGGWELAWLWGYGSKPLKIGSRGVVTAMAMNAIEQARRRDPSDGYSSGL